MYKLTQKTFYGEVVSVQRISDSAFIPFDQNNSDYQAYLKWLAEGNQPLPADEGTPSA
jgi:hypothetical protein